jgi:DNA-directed RNA polymerase sigma subunit (sigma70/sigma32)
MRDLSLQQLNAEHRMLVAIFGDKALRIKDEAHDFPIPNEHFDLSNIVAVIEELDPYSQEVVRSRFGLGDLEPQSIYDVAEKLGLSPQKVLAVVNRALRAAHIHSMTDKEAKVFYFLNSLRDRDERVIMSSHLKDGTVKTDDELVKFLQISQDEISSIRERLIPQWSAFEISELD